MHLKAPLGVAVLLASSTALARVIERAPGTEDTTVNTVDVVARDVEFDGVTAGGVGDLDDGNHKRQDEERELPDKRVVQEVERRSPSEETADKEEFPALSADILKAAYAAIGIGRRNEEAANNEEFPALQHLFTLFANGFSRRNEEAANKEEFPALYDLYQLIKNGFLAKGYSRRSEESADKEEFPALGANLADLLSNLGLSQRSEESANKEELPALLPLFTGFKRELPRNNDVVAVGPSTSDKKKRSPLEEAADKEDIPALFPGTLATLYRILKSGGQKKRSPLDETTDKGEFPALSLKSDTLDDEDKKKRSPLNEATDKKEFSALGDDFALATFLGSTEGPGKRSPTEEAADKEEVSALFDEFAASSAPTRRSPTENTADKEGFPALLDVETISGSLPGLGRRNDEVIAGKDVKRSPLEEVAEKEEFPALAPPVLALLATTAYGLVGRNEETADKKEFPALLDFISLLGLNRRGEEAANKEEFAALASVAPLLAPVVGYFTKLYGRDEKFFAGPDGKRSPLDEATDKEDFAALLEGLRGIGAGVPITGGAATGAAPTKRSPLEEAAEKEDLAALRGGILSLLSWNNRRDEVITRGPNDLEQKRSPLDETADKEDFAALLSELGGLFSGVRTGVASEKRSPLDEATDREEIHPRLPFSLLFNGGSRPRPT